MKTGITGMREIKSYVQGHVELCRGCKGDGRRLVWGADDPLRMREPVVMVCDTCCGSGRVIVSKEVVTRVEAYRQKDF